MALTAALVAEALAKHFRKDLYGRSGVVEVLASLRHAQRGGRTHCVRLALALLEK